MTGYTWQFLCCSGRGRGRWDVLPLLFEVLGCFHFSLGLAFTRDGERGRGRGRKKERMWRIVVGLVSR